MIVILILYGFTIWLSAIAYALITGQWSAWNVFLAGPLVVSSAVLALGLADYAVCSAAKRWLARKRTS